MGTKLPFPKGHSTQFSAHVHRGEMAGWISDTWHGVGPRPRPHCASLLEAEAEAPILAHFYCGQTAGWIKMPLGTEVGLGPGDTVLRSGPAPHGKAHSSLGACLSLLWSCHGFCAVVNYTSYHRVLVALPASVNRGPCLLWRNGRPSQLLLSTCYHLRRVRLNADVVQGVYWFCSTP